MKTYHIVNTEEFRNNVSEYKLDKFCKDNDIYKCYLLRTHADTQGYNKRKWVYSELGVGFKIESIEEVDNKVENPILEVGSIVLEQKRDPLTVLEDCDYVKIDRNKKGDIIRLDKIKKEIAEESSKVNILVIGDNHLPFTIKGYLEFCKSMYVKYSCNTVVFIGDIIDFHYSSYHETDPDGHSAGEELELCKQEIKKWYDTFPIAKVCLGNHDIMAVRKAKTSAVSKQWVRDIKEVLNTPNWEFKDSFEINNIIFYHGIGMTPENKTKSEMASAVCGHTHSKSYIRFSVDRNNKPLFSMNVGCGIQRDSYAFAYGKHFASPHINCGIIVDGVPIIEYMDIDLK